MTKKHKTKKDAHEEEHEEEQQAGQQEQQQEEGQGCQCNECGDNQNQDGQPDYYSQLVQLKADFENYRKRVEREKPALINWGKMEMLLKLLPLYDTVISAAGEGEKLKAADPGNKTIDAFLQGLGMINKEYQKVFDSEGITVIDGVNVPYDPMLHEVMTVVEANDENDGKVAMVFQKGFKSGDRVIRPARIALAKKKQSAPKQEQQQENAEEAQEENNN